MSMGELDAAIGMLEYFNEKVEELQRSTFVGRMTREPSGARFSWSEGKPLVAERTGPDEESIKAFLLTYRFFINDGREDEEGISLRRVAKLYKTLPLDASVIENVRTARRNFNQMLDEKLPVNLNDRQLTRRMVFEIFVWGNLAHANKKQKAIYDAWFRDEFTRIIRPLLEYELTCTLVYATQILSFIREVNFETIQILRATAE